MDPLATETSEFWRNVGPFNDVKSAEIQTEVIACPPPASPRTARWSTAAAGCNGTGRAPGPGEAQTDIRIMSELFLRLRKRYQAEGGTPTRC
jgi:formate dehydrogenase major subunit